MLIMPGLLWWERIKQRIEELDLNPYAVARATGLSRPAIVNIIAGDIKSPRRETIQAIARVLGVSEQWIYEGDVPVAENRAAYTASSDYRNARLWEKFAAHFKAGDPETFAEVVASLPKNDQAMLVRLAKLLDIESKLG